MRKRKLLDIGCGAGGAAEGYHQVLGPGWEIHGVDIVDQPRYPFEFHKADGLAVLMPGGSPAVPHWDGFDAIHCSWPCQRWSPSTLSQRVRGTRYPDLITPARPLLQATGLPWVMENVPEAPLRADVGLCGCQFSGTSIPGVGQLRRRRKFELSWWTGKPVSFPHTHTGPAITICGHGTTQWQRRLTGHVPVAQWRQVMGIDWMNRDELGEAIPPAYTSYIGALLLAEVIRRAA
jgi:DNA (cytosine-5)-methyltransferase 1